jgi:predicted nucleic acid-binding protein
MIGYADTSFLVSLYLPDVNSTTAWDIMKKRPHLYLTPLHELEFANAIELAVFRKYINKKDAKSVLLDFEQDRNSIFTWTQMPEEIYIRAEKLAMKYTSALGTRSLDILHVATALMLKPDAFFTFDERQKKLAKAELLHIKPR